jgi:hypothetical protein
VRFVKKHVINLHIHIYVNNTLTAKNSSDAETNIFNILYNVLDYKIIINTKLYSLHFQRDSVLDH